VLAGTGIGAGYEEAGEDAEDDDEVLHVGSLELQQQSQREAD
jgi:hypothetical protein